MKGLLSKEILYLASAFTPLLSHLVTHRMELMNVIRKTALIIIWVLHLAEFKQDGKEIVKGTVKFIRRGTHCHQTERGLSVE